LRQQADHLGFAQPYARSHRHAQDESNLDSLRKSFLPTP
jgi:hypothetical protein